MLRQRISDEFNLKKQADDLGVKIWQTPSFLFIIMGIIIVAAMTGIYVASAHYDSPEIIIISESLVVVLLLTIGNSVITTVEQVAKANKMKTEFVSIASHQLKTPLSEISWEIELLISKFKEGLSEKQQEIISEIAKSNKKMVRLVSDLLDVARIEQGRLALNVEAVDLQAIAKSVMEDNKILAKVNHAKLTLKTGKKPPEVLGDRRKLMVVLDNLVSNGIKYVDKKGKVEISVKKEKNQVIVRVSDNGVGIPKNEQSNVFQKFFRSNNATKNQTEGTGLGLFIAKNIIEQSGGSLKFNSKENEGSVFFFTMPIAPKTSEAKKLTR